MAPREKATDMAGTHARLSASGAERFMECPGSVALTPYVDNESSEYADEGTRAHALGERCLREEVDAWMLVGEEIDGVEIDPDTAEHVQVYVDYIREQSVEGAVVLLEHSFTDPELGTDFGGTSDAVVYSTTKASDGTIVGGFVHIIDYKHGIGIPVEIQGNLQLRYYAYGVLRSLGISAGADVIIKMTIVQPRAEHRDGPIRSEEVTAREILRWGEEELLPAMRRVNEEPDTFLIGSHCRFCPAKLICPKMKEIEMEAASEDLTLLEGLTDTSLSERFERLSALTMFIKAVKDECYKRAMAGAPVPGTKLILGRSSRVLKEGAEDTAIEIFGEDAFTEPALKSPAQLEKLPGGKTFTAEWAYKQPGNPTLVPSDAPGVAYDPRDAGAGFACIDTPAE